MSALLHRLYDYHAWANTELFGKLETINRVAHARELQTMLRLINHHHVVARIFAAHLSGARHPYTADNTEDTPDLDALRAAVTTCDRWYIDYLQGLTAEHLAEALPFVFTDGDKGCMTREEILMHVALHAGGHRGEVCRILWQLSVTPPWDTFAVYLHQAQPERRLRAAS
jgi:uncharacterized damage-inducible protein DinB